MESHQRPEFDIRQFKPNLPMGIILPVMALALLAIVFLSTLRMGHVTGEQVGVLLNKITGKTTVINQSGVRFYNGITSDFHVLDRTLQTIEMMDPLNQQKSTGENLKIKTIDGSDVYVDLKVQYRIDPDMADVILKTSGAGNAFKEKWARDYVRSITRNFLGELTTEDFYDSTKRNDKIVAARDQANQQLQKFGLVIDSIVLPTKPRFYREYEEMIKKKKLADQAVLEEQSKALAAKQKQQHMMVEETNKKNVAVEEFGGRMEQKVIQAEAEAERLRKQSEAYFAQYTIGAEARLYQMQKEAEGVLAQKKAEAEGIENLKKAMEGPGGRNMVKLEYARKLKGVVITGRPFTLQARTERFEHMNAPAAASPAARPQPDKQ